MGETRPGQTSSPRQWTAPPPRVTSRQMRWWTPTRIALGVTSSIWLVLFLIGLASGIASSGEPPNEFYDGGSGAFAWTFGFLGIFFGVPLTVLVWLVALPFILTRAVRRHLKRRPARADA